MQYRIELRHSEPQATLGIEAETTIAGIPAVLGDVFPAAYEYAGSHGAEPAGPPFVLYEGIPQNDHVKLFAGMPVRKRIAGEGRVESRDLPGGDILVTEHIGPYEEMEAAYHAIMEWATEHGRKLREDMWEVYMTDPEEEPDPAKWRTEVYWPLE